MNNGFYSSFVCRSVLDVPYVLSNLSGDVTRWKKLWKLCISLDWFDEIASNLVDLVNETKHSDLDMVAKTTDLFPGFYLNKDFSISGLLQNFVHLVMS